MSSHDSPKRDSEAAERDEADTLEDIFDSALESLFGQHQAASGNPGQLCEISLEWHDDEKGLTAADSRIKFNIPPNSVNKLQAHYQWDAGAFAARLIYNSTRDTTRARGHGSDLQRSEADVRGLSVIELGAGTGLPGIVSARQGAGPVVITDYPDPSLLDAIRSNVSLSLDGTTCSQDANSCFQVVGLDWADPQGTQDILKAQPRGFDRIIAADVLWLSSMHEALLNTICNLLAKEDNPSPRGACVIVVSGFHTGRRALARFFTQAVRRGLVAKDPADVFEYNVVTRQSRPWSSTAVTFPSEANPAKTADQDEDDAVYDNMDDHVERSKWLLYVCLRRSSLH